MKILLICRTNSENKDLFEEHGELIMNFSSLWGQNEKTDVLLLNIAEMTNSISFLKSFLEPGGFTALQNAIQSDNSSLLSAAFSLLSTLDLNDWICPFSFEELLPLIVPIIWNGSMIMKWEAAKFMSMVAENKPEIFYPSFLEPNNEDSNEDPDPLNYARAFFFIIEIAVDDLENPIIVDIFDGLYSIGRFFHKKDQIHEFRETLDFYGITDYIGNFNDSQNNDIVSSVDNFNYTCVECLFKFD